VRRIQERGEGKKELTRNQEGEGLRGGGVWVGSRQSEASATM
jgi:hypothetical protein